MSVHNLIKMHIYSVFFPNFRNILLQVSIYTSYAMHTTRSILSKFAHTRHNMMLDVYRMVLVSVPPSPAPQFLPAMPAVCRDYSMQFDGLLSNEPLFLAEDCGTGIPQWQSLIVGSVADVCRIRLSELAMAIEAATGKDLWSRPNGSRVADVCQLTCVRLGVGSCGASSSARENTSNAFLNFSSTFGEVLRNEPILAEGVLEGYMTTFASRDNETGISTVLDDHVILTDQAISWEARVDKPLRVTFSFHSPHTIYDLPELLLEPGQLQYEVPLVAHVGVAFNQLLIRFLSPLGEVNLTKVQLMASSDGPHVLVRELQQMKARLMIPQPGVLHRVILPPGGTFVLDGAPVQVKVDNNIEIMSSGLGFVIDAGYRSRVLMGQTSSHVYLRNIHLTRGDANEAEVDPGDGGCVYLTSVFAQNTDFQPRLYMTDGTISLCKALRGGALAGSSSFFLSSVNISFCYAQLAGGAIFLRATTELVVNSAGSFKSSWAHNSAGEVADDKFIGGGAIAGGAFSITLYSVDFTNCSNSVMLLLPRGGSGGGAFLDWSDVSITKCSSTLLPAGGAIRLLAGYGVIRNLTVEDCSGERGGAIYVSTEDDSVLADDHLVQDRGPSTSVVLMRANFLRTHATVGGAIFASGNSALSLEESVIKNASARYGGGIAVVDGANLRCLNSSIRDCKAEMGGAVIAGMTRRERHLAGMVVSFDCIVAGGLALPTLLVHSTVIKDCTATHHGGGAVSFIGGSGEFDDVDIVDCVAAESGGGIMIGNSSSVIATRVRFNRNRVTRTDDEHEHDLARCKHSGCQSATADYTSHGSAISVGGGEWWMETEGNPSLSPSASMMLTSISFTPPYSMYPADLIHVMPHMSVDNMSARNITIKQPENGSHAQLGLNVSLLKCADSWMVDLKTGEQVGVCGVDALCFDQEIQAGLSAPICSCDDAMLYTVPQTIANTTPELTPYVEGCYKSLRGQDLVVTTTEQQLQVTLRKTEFDTPEVTRYIQVQVNGTNPFSELPKWSVTSDMPHWASVVETNGIIPFPPIVGIRLAEDAGFDADIGVNLRSAGLEERDRPYTTSIQVLINTSINTIMTCAIRLTIEAKVVAAKSLLGLLPRGAGSCSEIVPANLFGLVTNRITVLDVQTCDVDGLPVRHELPTDEDARAISATISPSWDSSLVQNLAVEYSRRGSYEVMVTSQWSGNHTIVVRLGDEMIEQAVQAYVNCPAGRHPSGNGACACVAGYFGSYNALDASIECVPCEKGHFKSDLGNGLCTRCPVGHIAPEPGAKECSPCPSRMFQDLEGQWICNACPSRTNSTPGSAACQMCAAGFYRTDASVVPTENSCERCGVQVECPPNSTVATLVLRLGYWRLSPRTEKILECSTGKEEGQTISACLGGSDPGVDGLGYCLEGTTGPKCSICVNPEEYFDGTGCSSCTGSGRLSSTIGVVVGVLAIFALAYSLFWLKNSPSSPLRERIRKSWFMTTFIPLTQSLSVLPKVKMTITFLQLAIAMPEVYNVTMPEQYTRWMEIFSSWLDVDVIFNHLYPSECLGSFPVRMTLRVVGPVIFILCIVACAGAYKVLKRARHARKRRARRLFKLKDLLIGLPASLIVAFCFYPSVSRVIFQAWVCEAYKEDDQADESHHYLSQDLSIRCSHGGHSSDEHNKLTLLASMLIVLWPIGVPLVFCVLAALCRHSINDIRQSPVSAQKPPLAKATYFLWREYRTAIWWWEPIEMVRKVLLAGMLVSVLPTEGSIFPLVAAMIISLVLLVATLFIRPYRRSDNNAVSVCLQLAQIFMYLTAMVIKLHSDFAREIGVTLTTDVMGFQSSYELSLMLFAFYGVLLVAVIFTLAAQGYYAFVAREKLKEEENRHRLKQAVANITTLRFSACFVKLHDFEAAGELRSHEYMRDAHKLVMLDTYDRLILFVRNKPTVFCSHQWLGFHEPDPRFEHFPAIVRACHALCRNQHIDPDELYVWVDFTSIPQENNFLKQLAIQSLAQYASSCRYFLIVAPHVLHADSGMECDPQTYARRGWCRLEQWARLASAGRDDMYLAKVDEVVEMDSHDSWFEDSIMVFEGDFTCDSDKEKLVDTVVGLWAIMLFDEYYVKGGSSARTVMATESSSPMSAQSKQLSAGPSPRSVAFNWMKSLKEETSSGSLFESSISLSSTKPAHKTIFDMVVSLRERVFPEAFFGPLTALMEEKICREDKIDEQIVAALRQRKERMHQDFVAVKCRRSSHSGTEDPTVGTEVPTLLLTV